MDRIISIIAGTAVLSGALVLLGWFSLPVRVVMLVGVTAAAVLACRRGGAASPPACADADASVAPHPARAGDHAGSPLRRIRPFVLRHSSFVIPPLLSLAPLLILSSSAATDPIRSPWSVVPSAFFALYALLAGVTAILAFRGSRAATLGIACTIAVGSAVALLVYPIGFGFDHFIHAAAERIITDTGALTPRPFFYSAHYGLVALIATLGIPVVIADRLLAPLLTVFLLVPLAIRTLTTRGALALLLIPFLPLAVSTPQATANVFALMTTLLLVVQRDSYKSRHCESAKQSHAVQFIEGCEIATSRTPRNDAGEAFCKGLNVRCFGVVFLSTLAAFLSNPLTGIPLLGAVAAVLFVRARHRTLAVFSAIGGVIGIPIALAVATRTNTALDLHIGFSLSPLRAALVSIRDALTFHAADFATADALALARVVLPVAWIVFAMIGAWGGLSPSRWEGEIKRGWSTTAALIATTIALASATIVSLTTTLSSQLPEEQSQLPLRLLSLAAILSVPLVGRAISRVMSPPSRREEGARGGGAMYYSPTHSLTHLITFSALATFTLLLSYPRDDAQARSGLWSVSADDITAVHAIANDAGDSRYVVLSNQMLAAAAIREFGFHPAYAIKGAGNRNEQSAIGNRQSEILAFPLPAGGPLAQHFWSYLEQQNRCTQFGTAVQNCVTAREPIDAAMRLVSADRAYVVLHAYWRTYDRLAAATATIADAEVGNFPNIRIFRFTAPPP